MLHPDGESGAARSAARRGLPYTLSTMATTSIEDLASAVSGAVPGAASAAVPGLPGGPSGEGPALWFQLYVLKDRAQVANLLDRAWGTGYQVLVVTVDTVVAGNRIRDKRNGLSIPPELSLQTIAQVASRPAYWYRLLTGPALDYASFAGRPRTTIMQTASFFDPGLNWDDIASLRSAWKGKLVIKGPLGPADAARAVDAGCDGIQLSNHGGRQLDRAIPTVELIEPVREAVGDSAALLVDSGIRHGADAVVALALGADAAVLGRAYVYGLMAGGEPGVDRALDILTAQFRSTMQLLGVTSVTELRKHGRELLARADTSP
jgi:L-lactate dehydrogenase (cytochrome)